MRKENPVANRRVHESRVAQPPPHRRRPYELRVLVELAGIDGVASQRIQRIVLEHEEATAGTQHSADLPEQRDVLVVRDVMEYARSQRNVECAVVERNLAAVEVPEIGRAAVLRSAD